MNDNLMMARIPMLAALSLALLATGCGHKTENKPDTRGADPDPPVQSPAEVSQATPAISPVQPPQPSAIGRPQPNQAAAPPVPAVIPVNDPSAMLGALTQAVRKYSAEKQRVPASLSEVAGAGYIQSMPQPPAGKRFVIDKKRLVVELAN